MKRILFIVLTLAVCVTVVNAVANAGKGKDRFIHKKQEKEMKRLEKHGCKTPGKEGEKCPFASSGQKQ